VQYVPISPDEYRAFMRDAGVPDDEAARTTGTR
jgi:hypothetical protein